MLVLFYFLFQGDDYEVRDQPKPNRLDDIKDWNSGNKSIAEEALDKVKEIISGIKLFDTAEDYSRFAVHYHTFVLDSFCSVIIARRPCCLFSFI